MSPSPTPTRAVLGSALSGQAAIEDYLGTPAGEAARAVRRAGLRPALDRQVGHASDLAGLVVAQDPPAGETLARGAMVTLYVAAPSPEQGTPEADPTRDEQHAPADAHSGREQAPAPADRSRPASSARASFSYGPSRQPSPPSAVLLRSVSSRRDGPNMEQVAPRAFEGAQEQESGEAGFEPGAPAPPSSERADPETEAEAPPSAPDHDTIGLAESMRDAFTGVRRPRRYPREPLGLRAAAALASARRHPARILLGAILLGWLAFALAHRGDGATGRPAPVARPLASAPRPSTAPARPRRAKRRRAAAAQRPTRRHAHEQRTAQGHPAPAPSARTEPAPPSTEPPPAPEPRRSTAGASAPGGPFSP